MFKFHNFQYEINLLLISVHFNFKSHSLTGNLIICQWGIGKRLTDLLQCRRLPLLSFYSWPETVPSKAKDLPWWYWTAYDSPFPRKLLYLVFSAEGVMVLDYTLQRTGLLTPMVVSGHMTINALVATVWEYPPSGDWQKSFSIAFNCSW